VSPRVERQFAFCGYELDLGTRRLCRDGGDVELRPKSFDVLAFLVRHAGKLVTRDEIIAAVWPGMIASDESLSRCISDVRQALDDTEKEIIRTIPGKGYQFSVEVTAVAADEGPAAAATLRPRWRIAALALSLAAPLALLYWFAAPDDRTQSRPYRPSLAVVPFKNIGEEAAFVPFAKGLTSDLNASLARIPELLVIAESATRHYAGKDPDVRRVAEEMRVEYVLTGTVQGNGDRVRVAAQLSNGADGSAVWSQRYDREIADFLDLQDDIAKRVLTGLQIELTHGETARALSLGTDSLEAWLLHTEGLAEGFRFKEESNQKARALFTAAMEIDPDWAAPLSGVAWTYREALRRGWSNDEAADRAQWRELAERCKAVDPAYAGCYIQLGNYHIENGRIKEGIALRERALALAPNDLSALSGLAWQLILVGRIERGLELLQRAKLVSPLHPGWLIATEAYGYQMAGRTDKAIEGFRYALDHGDFPDWHARLAAAYVDAGEIEMAREQARLFVEKRPGRKVADLTRILRIQDPAVTERYAASLREAGIPE